MNQLAVAMLPPVVLEKRIAAWIQRQRGKDPMSLGIELWNGRRYELAPRPQVTFRLHRPSALACLLRPSLLRLGEAYIEGHIDIDGAPLDIVAVGSHLASRAGIREPRSKGLRWHHSHRLDADSVQYHYDLSDEFYGAWLDGQMVYSCAYFRDPADSLEAAQEQKLDHILTKIRLQPGQRLLDIGCGWGALVIRAAAKFGAHATGITLSHNQCAWAQRRIAEAGLGDRCDVRLMDYRDVTGQFDRITSVGMFEHVGLKNLGAYFRKIHDLLADGGVVMNHGITSSDPASGGAPYGGGEFIDRYVFPNGELPHISLALREMALAGLEAHDVENLRRHYALTLRHWSGRFEAASARVRALVGDRRYRIWRIYLAGCAYAFEQNWMALHQILASKATHTPGYDTLPLTRDYMYPSPLAGESPA